MTVVALGSPDDDYEEQFKMEEEKPEKKNLSATERKEKFFLVANLAAYDILTQKKKEYRSLKVKTIHLFDDHYRVQFFEESKMKHDVLVKIRPDFTVREVRMDR